MRDPRDGTYRLLDVNARTWGYHTLGRRAGVDFPYLLFQDQTGQRPGRPGHAQARPGVSWVRLVTDVPNAVRDLRAGTLRPGGYLRSLLTADTEAVFSVSDPAARTLRTRAAALPGSQPQPLTTPPTPPLGGAMFAASTQSPSLITSACPTRWRPGAAARPRRSASCGWPTGTGRRPRGCTGCAPPPMRGPRPGRAAGRGQYELADFTFFGEVARDAAVPALLAGVGGQWLPVTPIRGAERPAGRGDLAGQPAEHLPAVRPGRGHAAVLVRELPARGPPGAGHGRPRGRAARLLPGPPGAPPPGPAAAAARVHRPAGPPAFPRWPLETSLHDFYTWLFELIAGLTGTPVPYLDVWPDQRSWAMVLTHDVETAAGQQQVETLRGLERARGLRSSWNFVGERYEVDAGLVRALQEEGCEVGVHGLRHDGRDLASRRLMERRLPAMRQYAGQWGAVGFRSPGTQRHWDLMPRLGFEYDSSYSDTDPYEPQPGGCCTYLPYFNRDMVELPITMPQDHTLFAILQQPDGRTVGAQGQDAAGARRDGAGAHPSRLRRRPAGPGRVPRGARRALRRCHRLARAAARGRGLVAQPGRLGGPRAAADWRSPARPRTAARCGSRRSRPRKRRSGRPPRRESGLAQGPDHGVAQAPDRTRQDGRGVTGPAQPGNPQQPVIQAAREEFRHRTDRETADVVAVADMQSGRLPADHQEQAIVQRGEIRRGHDQRAAWPQYPPHLSWPAPGSSP